MRRGQRERRKMEGKRKEGGERKGGILCSCDLLGTLASLAETAEPSEMSSAEERTDWLNSEQPGVG